MLFYKLTDQENIPSKLLPLQLNGNIIERENSLKFLGVILDECLIWKKDIYNLLKLRSRKTSVVLYKASSNVKLISCLVLHGENINARCTKIILFL